MATQKRETLLWLSSLAQAGKKIGIALLAIGCLIRWSYLRHSEIDPLRHIYDVTRQNCDRDPGAYGTGSICKDAYGNLLKWEATADGYVWGEFFVEIGTLVFIAWAVWSMVRLVVRGFGSTRS